MEDSVTIETLQTALTQKSREATFSCGGTLTANNATPVARPLSIIYKDKIGGFREINLPASEREIETLADNCEAATFGVLEEEKLDLDYRSAWKMDNSRFLTSFHPFDTDIMEVIKKLFFPGAVDNVS